MRVLLEPAGAKSRAEMALREVGRVTQRGESASLIMVHDSAQLPSGTYADSESLPSAERSRAFVQWIGPPPHLLICGAAPDAQPVAGLARTLGWRITVMDHRRAYADSAKFPGAEVRVANPGSLHSEVNLERCHAAVVMSHHLPSDEAYLRELAEAGVPAYVGLLGPKARRARLAQDLGPLIAKLGGRIRGPVGLDIGATTPEAIALAIIAQIHAWLAGRPYNEAVLT